MEYKYNKEAFKEQEKFLKMLAKKLKLADYKCLGSYLCCCESEKKDFLNKQLIKCINDGKLINWLIDEIKKNSINQLGENIDIDYFWSSYCYTLGAMGLGVPSDFSDSEEKKLKLVMNRHCFGNSICDFHESDDEDDDGSTVFAYTETRRYM